MNEATSSQSEQIVGALDLRFFTFPANVFSYAVLDENNIVVNLIMAQPEFIQTLPNSGSYVLAHDPENPRKSKGNIGTIYDKEKNAFVYPQPFPSWTLDENFNWTSPVPFPTDEGDYEWDEDTLSWKPL